MIKFNLHNVTDTETKAKARVHYDLDNHISGKPCVTLYGKTCLENLSAIFKEGVENNTDLMTDYFEDDRIRFFEGDKHYNAARATAERMKKKQEARWAKRYAA